MHILTLDFETYWSKTHSLSKLSPIEYVMHPDTEMISCSIKLDDYPTDVVFGEAAIRRFFAKVSPDDKLALAHNMSGFDALLLAWRLNWRPKLWGCTLAMARPMHERTTGVSLAKLVEHYGLGKKDNTVLLNTQGKHLADFTPEEIHRMRIYNKADTEQCYALFKKLRPLTSNREMWAIDSNIRMMVDDEFELDKPLLQTALAREQAKKRKTLLALAEQLEVKQPVAAGEEGEFFTEDDLAQAVKDELMSGPKFAALLTRLGVDVPTKPSPTDADKQIPALSKDDPEFQELLEDDNDLVAAAARARLEMKSTLLETRIQAFLAAGGRRQGRLPIPAKYYGAHTGRDSGELYNALNLPRIDRDKDDRIIPKLTNALRLSLRAPKGKVVMAADLSGIEMRVNHTLWKVKYSTELWAKDATADIYKPTAARYYDIPEDQVDKPRRQFGKVLQLACGFQVGPPKFKRFARKFNLILSDEEARNGVYGWREITPEIADRDHGGWAKCQQALEYILAGQEQAIDPWGLTHTEAGGIRLPDGRLIRYPDLRRQVNEKTGYIEWKYGQGRHTRFIYGGSMDENIVQALARIVLMDNVMEFWKRTGLRTKLRVYDEAVYIVDEAAASDLLKELLAIMRTPPKWWPQLVVWSEGDCAPAYGLAK
jgi:DNA polymerase